MGYCLVDKYLKKLFYANTSQFFFLFWMKFKKENVRWPQRLGIFLNHLEKSLEAALFENCHLLWYFCLNSYPLTSTLQNWECRETLEHFNINQMISLKSNKHWNYDDDKIKILEKNLPKKWRCVPLFPVHDEF